MLYENYLNDLGIAPLHDVNAILEKISEATDPATLDTLLKLMDSRADGSNDASIYSVMNSSLDLSLAFVGSMDGSYLKKYLRTLEKSKDFLGETIADIGCNNGIITCFLAKTCQDSQVIGYDVNENAIATARQLAEELQLSNVSFEIADLKKIKRQFSTVITSKVSHEIVNIDRINWKTDKNSVFLQYAKVFDSYANCTSSMLLPNGSYITIDRIPYTAGYFGLYKALSRHDLSFLENQYRRITFISIDEEEIVPFAIFKKDSRIREKEVDYMFFSVPQEQYCGLEQ